MPSKCGKQVVSGSLMFVYKKRGKENDKEEKKPQKERQEPRSDGGNKTTVKNACIIKNSGQTDYFGTKREK
jgi:hypothetical protein